MDLFGIGSAMKAMTRVYFQSARGAGRTISMIDSLHDGDRIVFTNPREAERVSNMCCDRGITITCTVISTKTPERIFEHGTSQGRTILDHSFVEQMYEERINACAREIDNLERESSGYGEAHRETKRQAYEMNKWRM